MYLKFFITVLQKIEQHEFAAVRLMLFRRTLMSSEM